VAQKRRATGENVDVEERRATCVDEDVESWKCNGCVPRTGIKQEEELTGRNRKGQAFVWSSRSLGGGGSIRQEKCFVEILSSWRAGRLGVWAEVEEFMAGERVREEKCRGVMCGKTAVSAAQNDVTRPLQR
jgi:hypothetical protein